MCPTRNKLHNQTDPVNFCAKLSQQPQHQHKSLTGSWNSKQHDEPWIEGYQLVPFPFPHDLQSFCRTTMDTIHVHTYKKSASCSEVLSCIPQMVCSHTSGMSLQRTCRHFCPATCCLTQIQPCVCPSLGGSQSQMLTSGSLQQPPLQGRLILGPALSGLRCVQHGRLGGLACFLPSWSSFHVLNFVLKHFSSRVIFTEKCLGRLGRLLEQWDTAWNGGIPMSVLIKSPSSPHHCARLCSTICLEQNLDF